MWNARLGWAVRNVFVRQPLPSRLGWGSSEWGCNGVIGIWRWCKSIWDSTSWTAIERVSISILETFFFFFFLTFISSWKLSTWLAREFIKRKLAYNPNTLLACSQIVIMYSLSLYRMTRNQVHQTLLFKLLCVGVKKNNLACKTTSYHYLWKRSHYHVYSRCTISKYCKYERPEWGSKTPLGVKLHGETWYSVCADIEISSILLGQELIGRESNILGMCLHFLIFYPVNLSLSL